MDHFELVARAAEFHPWDAMAPAALAAMLDHGPYRATAETGCGGSTIVLSHESVNHTAFAIDGENQTVASLRQHELLRSDRVTFVEGETRLTLPDYEFNEELDLVLLDGPHAYPLPQIEYAYLFPWLRVGGWLVIDDLQIPSVYELFRFLREERDVTLRRVIVRTAFFERVEEADDTIDGWARQGMNRRLILRYSWRDRLRRMLGRH